MQRALHALVRGVRAAVGDWNVPATQGVHATLPGSVLNKPLAYGAHATPEWLAEKPARHSHCSRPRVTLRGLVCARCPVMAGHATQVYTLSAWRSKEYVLEAQREHATLLVAFL